MVEAPVLVYPDFSKDLYLETNVSVKGLGAILSQIGEKGRDIQCHMPVKPSQSQKERHMQLITELETLAVVWDFHHYLYGHNIQTTLAVKAFLSNPGNNDKHGPRYMVWRK